MLKGKNDSHQARIAVKLPKKSVVQRKLEAEAAARGQAVRNGKPIWI